MIMIQHHIDKKGRLALPREVWVQIGADMGEEAELTVCDGAIVIRRRALCRLCGGIERVDPEERICWYCARLIRLQNRLSHPMPG